MPGVDGLMRKKIVRALWSTWNAIADDLFVDDMGRRDISKVFTRDQVFEVACDRVSEFSKDKEVVRTFQGLGVQERREIQIEAFPLARYGW